MAVNGALKLLVVKIISTDEKDGVSIIKNIKDKTGWKVSYGSFYPLMKELVNAKLVKFEKKEKSKVYSLTKKGEKLLGDIEIKKKEIFEKVCEGIRLLKVMGEDDFKDFSESIEKGLRNNHLDFVSIHEQLVKQGDLLNELNISKNRNKINAILKKTNNELEKLK